MSLTIGVLKEQDEHEQRVSVDPEVTKRLVKAGLTVLVELGAGTKANFFDADYESVEGKITDRASILSTADVLTMISNPDQATLSVLKTGQLLIGQFNALTVADEMNQLASAKVNVLSLELVPRTISRAQTMDVLSSQASVAGYKAALLASNVFPKYFPMMITAAGTVKPAKVLVLGTGVAGLQAIGTAKRLGAIVSGYDVRPASRGEVESLGATFLTSSVF